MLHKYNRLNLNSSNDLVQSVLNQFKGLISGIGGDDYVIHRPNKATDTLLVGCALSGGLMIEINSNRGNVRHILCSSHIQGLCYQTPGNGCSIKKTGIPVIDSYK